MRTHADARSNTRHTGALEYRSQPVDARVRELVWQHRFELPERERALIEAGRADSLTERLEQTRAVTRRFPDSWRAWFSLAELLIHQTMFLGTTVADARAAMKRAVALHPTSSTLWQHLFWMTLADQDTPRCVTRWSDWTASRPFQRLCVSCVAGRHPRSHQPHARPDGRVLRRGAVGLRLVPRRPARTGYRRTRVPRARRQGVVRAAGRHHHWAPEDVAFASLLAETILGLDPTTLSDEQLIRALANWFQDHIVDLSLTVNVVPYGDLFAYRAETVAFNLIDTDFFDDLGNPISHPNLSVASICAVILAPLPPGVYTVAIRAEVDNPLLGTAVFDVT